MTHTPVLWDCLLLNAIHLPSGDHAGATSQSGLVVNRCGLPGPIWRTQMSKLSGEAPFQEYAMRVPSGENEGQLCKPGSVVNGVRTGSPPPAPKCHTANAEIPRTTAAAAGHRRRGLRNGGSAVCAWA